MSAQAIILLLLDTAVAVFGWSKLPGGTVALVYLRRCNAGSARYAGKGTLTQCPLCLINDDDRHYTHPLPSIGVEHSQRGIPDVLDY